MSFIAVVWAFINPCSVPPYVPPAVPEIAVTASCGAPTIDEPGILGESIPLCL